MAAKRFSGLQVHNKTMVSKETIAELISRYEQRKKMVWKHPNPYIKPLWEKTEIKSKISQLEKLLK